MAKDKKKADIPNEERNSANGETGASPQQKNIIDVVWDFLSSMKLGIALLLIMAIASIFGTIWIPVDPYTGEQDYVKYYNTWPFKILMSLLSLNLLICSLNRWKSITGTLKGPSSDFSDKFVKSLKSVQSFKLNKQPGQAAGQVEELLKKRGYRIFSNPDGEAIRVSSDRGHLGILGPYLTHISFMVILVAMMIKFSGFVGFDGSMSGLVGQTVNLGEVQGIKNIDPAEYFDIRINDFRTLYRPDGSVQQWHSDVTVIDKDKTFDYSISVNHPLIYKGIKFYQMSYGSQFAGTWSSGNTKGRQFTVGSQNPVYTDSDITFVPLGVDDRGVAVDIYKGNQYVGQQQVAVNTPLKYEAAEVSFTEALPYTVLSVKRDPGVPIIGVGSLLLMVGVILSFLLRQRRIWAIITPEKEVSMVYIGGISPKDKTGLENDLSGIIDEIKG
ncbi:MAG: cytochrome c biogenesis protein ResB [Thermincola sp.]|jgi:cytochrome c biogenesis protein|nr:cytochrome c biogenesis protein ResB [Thermincola sp.]MDT3702764.1 cytochrome c biogenesis protein ResB [Thermincola sp.]